MIPPNNDHLSLHPIAGCGRIAHIWQQGRAVYRSLFSDLMPSLFDINVPVLELEPSRGAAGELSRFAGTYAWPDRRVKVLATDDGLVIADERGAINALAIDDRTFLIDADNPDTPTVTFGAFDGSGHPGASYDMLWGLPRRRNYH